MLRDVAVVEMFLDVVVVGKISIFIVVLFSIWLFSEAVVVAVDAEVVVLVEGVGVVVDAEVKNTQGSL